MPFGPWTSRRGEIQVNEGFVDVRIDVVTLFPHWFDWFRTQRHVTNALALGHELDFVDLRETTPLKAGQVDDTPYGGGAGMVIRVDVVEAALEARYGQAPPPHRTIALSPAGRQFDDALAAELAAEPALTLLSGRYEGFDERVNEHLATDVVSIGPYVLAGGELAAMVVADAVIRKLPGALGHEESAVEESFTRRSRGRPSTRTTRARSTGAATRCRMCCCRATTRGSANGGWSRAAPGGAGSSRHLRYHAPSTRDGSNGRVFCAYVRSDRQHRAGAAAPSPVLPGGRSRARSLPGRRGHPAPYAGVRGHRDQAPGQRRARDVHRAQAVVRRGRGADVPGPLAQDRAHRGGRARRRSARQALLPARAGGPRLACARAPLVRGRGGHPAGADRRGGRHAARRRAAPGRGRARRAGRRRGGAAEEAGGRGRRRRRSGRGGRAGTCRGASRRPRRPLRSRWRTPRPRATTTSRAPRARAPGRCWGARRRSASTTR